MTELPISHAPMFFSHATNNTPIAPHITINWETKHIAALVCLYVYIHVFVCVHEFVCVHVNEEPSTENTIFNEWEQEGLDEEAAKAEGAGPAAKGLGRIPAASLECLLDEVGAQAGISG